MLKQTVLADMPRSLVGIASLVAILVSLSYGDSRPDSVVQKALCKVCLRQEKECFKGDEDHHWCCKCPPGFYLYKICQRGEANTTECLPCEDGFYMSEHNTAKECNKSKSSCEDLQHTHLVKGNKSVNNQCICNNGTYLDHDSQCKPHLKCLKDHGVAIEGNLTHDTKCERCHAGLCSDAESSTERCSKCPDKQSANISSAPTTTLSLTTSVPISTTVNTDDKSNISTVLPLSTTVGENCTCDVINGTNNTMVIPVIVMGILLVIIILSLIIYCWRKKRQRDKDKKNRSLREENQDDSNGEEGSPGREGQHFNTDDKISSREEEEHRSDGDEEGSSGREEGQHSDGEEGSSGREEGQHSDGEEGSPGREEGQHSNREDEVSPRGEEDHRSDPDEHTMLLDGDEEVNSGEEVGQSSSNDEEGGSERKKMQNSHFKLSSDLDEHTKLLGSKDYSPIVVFCKKKKEDGVILENESIGSSTSPVEKELKSKNLHPTKGT